MSTEICLEHQIFITADGSPSLKPLSESSEWMHSKKGALAESLYIYGEAAQKAFEFHGELHIASVGLGLGYNELISAALVQSEQIQLKRLYSFEKVQSLQRAFHAWINGHESPLNPTYDILLQKVSDYFQLKAPAVKAQLQSWLEEGRYIELAAWPPTTPLDSKINCIFFDAYSSKSSPELWTFEALDGFLKNYTAQQCLFSTYAATGVLKRTLKSNDFKLLPREGFAGKRHSTLAVRR